MQAGQLEPAVASPRRAVELNPEYSEAHYSLAHALNAAGQPAVGRFEEATQTAEEAEAIAVTSAPGLVDGIQARLALYRAGRPVVITGPS